MARRPPAPLRAAVARQAVVGFKRPVATREPEARQPEATPQRVAYPLATVATKCAPPHALVRVSLAAAACA
jgi:hypothetical protein